MKKILFLAAAVAMTAASANAQNKFGKGDWFVGLSGPDMAFGRSIGNDLKPATFFELNGYGGWFFSDKFAVEAEVGTSMIHLKSYKTETELRFGTGLRYYPVGNLFGSVGYEGVKMSETSLYSSLWLKVGYDLFLTDNVFFEPALYYLGKLPKTVPKGIFYNTFGVTFSFGIKF